MSNEIIEALGRLKITPGIHAGENFVVLPWQAKFIRGAFSPKITQAVSSVARGNGKTELASGLACCSVLPDFPLVTPFGETICISSSFTPAKIIFEGCLRIAKPWTDAEPDRWRIQNSVNTASIEDRKTGAKIKCIGSDSKRAHGIKNAVLLICDEVAQWPQSTSDLMRSAIATARGKTMGSRLIAIGTKPARVDNWFSKMVLCLDSTSTPPPEKNMALIKRQRDYLIHIGSNRIITTYHYLNHKLKPLRTLLQPTSCFSFFKD